MPIGYKLIIIFSTLILLLGWLGTRHPKLLAFLFAWFGKLPGDFNYDNGETNISLPLVSILLISLFIGFVSSLFM